MTVAPEIDQMVVSIESDLRTALAVIDRNAQGVCFITEGAKLRGILTDGDIRRAFLAGGDMNSPVQKYMQVKIVTLPSSASPIEIQQALSDKIRHVPLVDDSGNMIDYVSNRHVQRIPLAEPSLTGNELSYVTECIRTNWISSRGRFVSRFEEMFSEFHGVPEALAVSNGTVALSLALEALGVGAGDEVIVPDLTFAASINAVIHIGATPVIVDIDPLTWTLNPQLVEKAITSRTKAVMPVHLYGHPADMTKIGEISERHGILIVEDCAEALGSKVNGRVVGSFGDAACFSFFGNKTITTGEGGMILFRDSRVAHRARVLRDHGMSLERKYWHEVVGYNYRLTNIQAAIGVAQMERIDSFLKHKRDLAAHYSEELRKFEHLVLPTEAEWAFNTYWLYSVLLLPDSGLDRDELIRSLALNGIEARPLFYPLHAMPIYESYCKGESFPVSVNISASGISLPSASSTTLTEVKKIANEIHSAIQMRAFSNESGLKDISGNG